MKEKIGISIILLMAMLILLPPHFAEGGVFAVEGLMQVQEETFVKVPDLYFDNSFFTILFLLLSYICFVLPFILPKWKKINSIVSILLGAWFFGAFIHEVWNIRVPNVVLNSSSEREVFVQYTVAFIIGIVIAFIREIWLKSKLEK